MLSEEQAIEKLKKIREDTIKANECGLSNNDFKEEIEVYDVILNLVKKQQQQLETIKEYVHQEIVHYTETIKDYIDDDKEGNKHYIEELKEKREHWRDVEKLLQNKPKEELYMNWWKYGLYE